ncbi:MAG TPA: hypothetical protein H9700_05515, partial [Candidatus Eisenbergiella intestinipullorum]|nr:hypothetical protein [Candidatus Eisenbergiella intestinipullorum]
PDGLFFNRQFCAEAQNCCDRRGEITCVISPRGLSVERFGMEVKIAPEKRQRLFPPPCQSALSSYRPLPFPEKGRSYLLVKAPLPYPVS